MKITISKNPWANRWFVRQSKKAPKYYCVNCYKLFRTGRFNRKDSFVYDDVCPNCGAIGLTFVALADEYKELILEHDRRRNENN